MLCYTPVSLGKILLATRFSYKCVIDISIEDGALLKAGKWRISRTKFSDSLGTVQAIHFVSFMLLLGFADSLGTVQAIHFVSFTLLLEIYILHF